MIKTSVKKTNNLDLLKNVENFITKKPKIILGVLNNMTHQGKKESSKDGGGGGIGRAELAAVHEFGSNEQNIPERSFLRKTMNERKDDFDSHLEKSRISILKSIANGGGEGVLQKFGMLWVRYIHETFDKQGPDWPQLSTVTLRRRKNFDIVKADNPNASMKTLINKTRRGSKILQDTGELKKSIWFEVSYASLS